MKLVIDENKWAAYGLGNGISSLTNSRGNMCCLGFLGAACTTKPSLLEGNFVPFRNSKIDWPEGVFYDYKSSSWTGEAMRINDSQEFTHEGRKERLIEHFKKIGVDLEFTK